MSKEIILMADIDGLGRAGDVVTVADGYARNYLLPKKKAAPVTAATHKQLEKLQAERKEREAEELAGAQKLSARVEQSSVTIAVKAGPEGKLFGSVSLGDILSAVAEQGLTLDKHQVKLDEPLRELGVFNLPVKLHPDVEATLKVWVVEE
jgi:large subunit ribosomal protein L9